MATIAQDKFTESNFTGQTISELPDRPNQAGMSAADLKARFDNIGKVLIALGKHNSLIDHLLATTDGSSGGDSIGMTAIPGVSGTTAQAVAESLKALIDAAVTGNIPDNSLGNIKLAADAKVGSLATLTTTEKRSAVGAINELDDIISNHKAEVSNYVQPVSRDISLPDGDQIISLVAGRTPKKITIYAGIPGIATSCWGVVGSNTKGVIAQASTGIAIYDAPRSIYLSSSPGNASSGTITIQSGQITIAWAKTESPTGTVSMIVIADYHD